MQERGPNISATDYRLMVDTNGLVVVDTVIPLSEDEQSTFVEDRRLAGLDIVFQSTLALKAERGLMQTVTQTSAGEPLSTDSRTKNYGGDEA